MSTSAARSGYLVFGGYPQTKADAIQAITSAQYNKNGDTTVDNVRDHRQKDKSGNFKHRARIWELL